MMASGSRFRWKFEFAVGRGPGTLVAFSAFDRYNHLTSRRQIAQVEAWNAINDRR